MSKPRTRRGLAIAIAASAVAVVTSAGSPSAYASHQGVGMILTAAGSDAIDVAGADSIPTGEAVGDVQWSPNGAVAAYVASNGEIHGLNFAGGDPFLLVDSVGHTRKHPTWSGDGSVIYWSDQATGTSTWRINASTSAPFWGQGSLTPDDGKDYTHPDAGAVGVLVAQRQDDASGVPTGTPEVVEISTSSGAVTSIITGASSPAVSPSGQQIAFVQSDGAHDQIYTSDMEGGNMVQVTSDAADHDNPAWSPDGTTIAFNIGGGVATASADGSTAASPTLIDGLSGAPAYEPERTSLVLELAGPNRFDTAIAISKAQWATAGDNNDAREPAMSVTLSRSDNFADAVSGSALAAAKEGPLLMTSPTSLTPVTQTEIERLLGGNTGATVYLLGGTGAISTSVENAIKGMGYQTVRLAGANRYETSIAIADAISPEPDLVLVATGMNFPDALGAGAAAGSYDASSPVTSAVVLTNNTKMPTATEAYLEDWLTNIPSDGEVFAIGGQADAALASEDWSGYVPLIGANRYETSALVAQEFFSGEFVAGVTTGLNWPDALAGGAVLGTLNGPLLLTSGSSTLNADTAGALTATAGSLQGAVVFGGTLPLAINDQIGVCISGPGGYSFNPLATTMPGLQTLNGKAPAGAHVGAHMKTPAKQHITRR